ncbi:EAL domain-containing protein [Colwellia hornerae]|uniref:EAL domain-containing protein n=1 Tax=Colwellia hornerae TaxID=89402 RepID=A0A5C6Q6W4_9GAMM|nr:EAL domain-containing protein [Colwellia hornerae]TWX49262.1 EAL domain-containing protein [Colwellia hornerae]TWX55854.1 EAL domain-containing protein [Colwellia hornerae]TWX64724.1 EAL domain-containing protein [Colwellia hornerae]
MIDKKNEQINILIVDDLNENLYILENLLDKLKLENLNTIRALSGEECLQISISEDIDLIILDIQMPSMNGFEVAKFLKSNAKTKNIPVVFLSATFKKEEFVQHGFELGAIDYFTKPIEKYSFLAKIKVYIKLFTKQKELILFNKNLDQMVNKKTFGLLRSQKELKETKQRYFDLYNLAPIGYCTLNEEGMIQESNLSASKLLGLGQNELINKSFASFVAKDYQHTYKLFSEALSEPSNHAECELKIVQPDKTIFWAYLSATTEKNYNALELRLLINNVSGRKIAEEKLIYMAHYDTLTGLPSNRIILADRLQQNMKQVKRRNQSLAVVVIDIDNFKAVNDTYGNDVGDQLLIALSKEMQGILRKEDTLARIGGDEFVIILSNLPDIKSSLSLITRLLNSAAQQFFINKLSIQVSASIGITFYPQAERIDPDHLLRQADQAMFEAKLSGKNRYHIFDTKEDDLVRERFEQIQRLREALNTDEFVLYYQPKVNMRTGEVVGAEALIRWEHPEKGLVPPNEFLPIMEGHALSISLGEWVIRSALKQIEHWQSLGIHIPISVNISALQLLSSNFFEQFEKILLEFPNVKPSFLEIEILETSGLEDLPKASKVINRCREFGVHFALDDFGTGYSSLSYLKKLALTYIKIDQSFVRDMLDDPNDLAIIEGVISLSDAFRMQVIAEGVETLEHGRILLQLGCELAQGYVIGRPMPSDKFIDWLGEWKPDSSWTKQSLLNDAQSKFLMAIVEKRLGLKNIVAFLKCESNNYEYQNIHDCHFSKLLKKYGDNYFESVNTLNKVNNLHESMHTLSEELLELHKNAQYKEVLQGIIGLEYIYEELIQEMSLMHERYALSV